MQLINIGYGSLVSMDRVVSIISPESSPIKRIVQEAKDSGMAIDATYGRKTRAVLIMDSGHVILSAVQPDTIADRAATGGCNVELYDQKQDDILDENEEEEEE